jgi:hypothetical protein
VLRTLALVACLALGAAACSRAAEPEPPAGVEAPGDGQDATGSSGSVEPTGSTGPTGETGTGGDTGEDAGGGGGKGDADAFEEDDLRVFAFATTDEAALAAELAAIAETVASLESHLQSGDLGAVEADALTLFDQAEALEEDAGAAADQQRPLEPSDAEMVDARRAALEAFGLTEEYAAAVNLLADATQTTDVSELLALLQQAGSVDATSEDVTQAYVDLNAALAAWAEANPAAAAASLTAYG